MYMEKKYYAESWIGIWEHVREDEYDVEEAP